MTNPEHVEFKEHSTEKWNAIVSADKNLPPTWVQSLTEPGKPKEYTGAALMKIGMPVGGLTTGLVYLGGDGKLWWWDIFGISRGECVWRGNITYKGTKVRARDGANYVDPFTTQPSLMQQGFAAEITVNGKTEIRTLDAKGWKNVTFSGCYPIGNITYSDPDCPVAIRLTAFSPFIPLDFDNSSYPATILRYSVENKGAQEAKVQIGGWMENAILFEHGHNSPGMERKNEAKHVGKAAVVLSSAQVQDYGSTMQPDFGTLALGCLEGGEVLAEMGGLSAEALFSGQPKDTATAPGSCRLTGGVRQKLTVPSQGDASADFVLAWRFPNIPEHKVAGFETGQYYAKRFTSAADVIAAIEKDQKRLFETTQLWQETWYDSTLPRYLLDRAIIPIDCLASTVCYRFGNGRFYTYEGVRCCEGHPNHVWHYAQGHARLFPELERDVIERTWYGTGFYPEGKMDYRGEMGRLDAFDGHCGVILCVYRDYLTSADGGVLKRIWPKVKQSIVYANTYDQNNDGLIDKPGLNTLDEPWHGELAWFSSLYIAALTAGEKMAFIMGDNAFAADCRQRAEKGRAAMDEVLFNGEWFIQKPDPKDPDKFGSYNTVHIDQVLGQFWAWQVGLGRVLNEATTKSALRSLWKYNFSRNLDVFEEQATPKGRAYFVDGEGGLLMTANALGEEKPYHGTSAVACYVNETMNGFEYQAAAHMISEGMVTEGLAVIKTIDERYDGNKRNPFDEIECGDHYARSMSSYGAFLAACGFEYNGPEGYMAFAPKITPDNFKAPFTAAEGWGSFSQKTSGQTMTVGIEVKWGKLRLQTLRVVLASAPTTTTVQAAGKTIVATVNQTPKGCTVTLPQQVKLTVGEKLEVTFKVL